MRLTNQSAAALKVPEGKAYVIVFDDDLAGFGMRANAGGSRVWVVQYRNATGQTKRETLGKVGVLSATDARRAAAERLAYGKAGGDTRYRWNEELLDHKRNLEVSAWAIWGLKKTTYNGDDFGTVVIPTYAKPADVA